MARLQILELPEVFLGEASETPFVLVVDEMPTDEAAFETLRRDLSDDVAQRIGARAVLAFEATVDIPANDTSAYLKDSASAGTLDDWDVRNAMAADLQTARDQVEAHEIRQRVDHACRAALADALGMDRTRDWDDIRNAATGLRRDRDAQAKELERLRAGEEPGWDHRFEPTPGQWIARWNEITPEKRLSMAAQILDGMSRASTCFTADHETQIARLLAELARLRGESTTPDA